MKLLSAAICLISAGVLSGCVDDRGYGGGYYATGVYYRTYDRDRYYRDYDRRWGDRRDWNDRRDWRDRRGWRGYDRPRYPVATGGVQYGVIVR